MPHCFRSAFILALLLCCLSCATVTLVPESSVPALTEEESAFAREGPDAVRVVTGEMPGRYGCLVRYEIHRPSARRGDVLVVLAHGFSRDLASMRGWARLWASHGVETVLASFCNSIWTAGNHDRNAEDLVALARGMHPGPVLYAGFSAGGLAAFLAAASDPRAVAYLGLDAVDSADLAGPASERWRLPALFLLAEPSPCNAQGNFLPRIPRIAAALRVRGAMHGHFENPYDPLVESVCGRVEPEEASRRILATVRALATAWILDRAAADPAAARILRDALAASDAWALRAATPR